MNSSYIPAELRQRISEQAHHRCGYCLTAESIVGTPMDIDHIIPQSKGGLTAEDNLWLACSLCNAHKSDRTDGLDPATSAPAPLFNPRHQRWTDHFVWSADGEHIVGITSTGRATVLALQLNRLSLVDARRRWVSVGWHPPPDP
jgi:5-methylcytosine-specific restriction endonuclease McrA